MGLKPVRGKINNKKRKRRIYRRIKLFRVAVSDSVFASLRVRLSDLFFVSWEETPVPWEETGGSSQGFDSGRVGNPRHGMYNKMPGGEKSAAERRKMHCDAGCWRVSLCGGLGNNHVRPTRYIASASVCYYAGRKV